MYYLNKDDANSHDILLCVKEENFNQLQKERTVDLDTVFPMMNFI